VAALPDTETREGETREIPIILIAVSSRIGHIVTVPSSREALH